MRMTDLSYGVVAKKPGLPAPLISCLILGIKLCPATKKSKGLLFYIHHKGDTDYGAVML